ncbi:MAG TPA: methyltransferase, partial [Campylobacterales bacterium]|nr:methyltransferase [Campylobacterales bacterium]
MKKNNQISFRAVNPDIDFTLFSGDKISIENQIYLYRGYKAWINLAELLQCRLLTPIKIDNTIVELSFQKLNTNNSFHNLKITDKTEKYGANSQFFSINKNEEPTFLWAYKRALNSVKIENRTDILNLGINRGDEFELIPNRNKNRLVGIDHSQSALDIARNRFTSDKYHFIREDI